ncbi:MAG: ABC transporter permease [Sandaracinaceae bacterium]|jgi:putative ABC transport system permease protein|nr:ABC transporter permease [Sandaracinaceae bacterium]
MVPISYNLRSLTHRKATTFATAFGITLVVFVFAASAMLTDGIKTTLGKSGSEDIAIVIRDGSDAELSSSLDQPNVGIILSSADVKRRADGQPDGVGEIVAVLALDKIGTEGVSNVQVRGVASASYAFRPTIHIVQGRQARDGAEEAVVGRAIAGRFRGLALGQSFEIKKNRHITVVGIMEDRGSSFESEVWTDIETVRSAFGREALVSSVRARLRSASAYPAFERALKSNRQLGVEVMRETDYYARQSEGTGTLISVMGNMIAFFFSLGAMIGAMITMYAAVSNRSREIGTLRALGFSKMSILFAFLLEALMLSLLGGIVGVLASLAMNGTGFSMMNLASWSEITFTFHWTPQIAMSSLIFAAVMGLFGGLFPAIRAARVNVLQALRS